MYLLVPPGPLINAELTDFGFPEWILLDPAIQARTAVGSLHLDAAWGFHPPRPYPVPSYASPAFYEAVGTGSMPSARSLRVTWRQWLHRRGAK